MSKEETKDAFDGDNAALVSSINSLLALDARGVLVPNGVCGLARQLLESAAERLEVEAQPVAGQSRFTSQKDWQPCSYEHHLMVIANPSEWPGYETRALFTRSDAGEVDRLNTVVEQQKSLIASLRAELRESHSITAAPAVERTQPISCDAANEENAPTFMGEPNPHHSIDWYREGIAKHWKTICDQRARLERLIAALKFYADREHYHFESGNWDTVSGEPLNILWCGDEPDFIEDGTVARAALSANVEPTNKECTQ